ncbi:MAG: transcriptional regulator [Cryobacterium sp.]|nr:transcriptional regulator [Cryobacterium sp.]
MTDAFSQHDWLTIPDLVDRLGMAQGRVRRLIEDKHLLAVRRDGVLKVPEVFLEDDAPLGDLRGTIFVLADDGFNDDQAMRWLLEVDDSLGTAPIAALRAGRKAEVRRVAQALA